MRAAPRLLTLLLIGLGMAGCGTKGALVLPPKPASAAKPAEPVTPPVDDSKDASMRRQ